MKICPCCGTESVDKAKYCKVCNFEFETGRIHSETEQMTQQVGSAPVPPPSLSQLPVFYDEDTPDRKFPVLILCAVAVLMFLVIVCGVMIKKLKTPKTGSFSDSSFNGGEVGNAVSTQSAQPQEFTFNSAEIQEETEEFTEPTETETIPMTETIPIVETSPIQDDVSQYIFVSGKFTWEEAQDACKQKGGKLATVHTDAQWNALMETVQKAQKQNSKLRYVWMGAKSDIDDDKNLTFSWVDNSETNYIMGKQSAWYYNQKMSAREPSGYDLYEYEKTGNLVREPYLMLWIASDSSNWTLNDVPDVTNYKNYQPSNMGYIMEIPEGVPIPTNPPATEPPETIPPATTPPQTAPTIKISPTISGEIGISYGQNEMGKTNIYTLYVNGNYDSYWIECDYYGYNGNGLLFSKKVSSSSLKLAESDEIYKVVARITPYYDDGTKGKEITCFYELEEQKPVQSVNVYSCYSMGEIKGKGVAGFTADYVVHGGARSFIREELGDRWHVTAYNYCYSKNILWYELYDTDDGDYYGWVDSDYIQFYQ